MADRYFQHHFDNGLTLLAENMAGVQSAAMTLLLPAGSCTDPADAIGCGTVLSDLVLRGAGPRDARQLTDWLDSLGLQRGNGIGIHHARFTSAALADKVMEGIGIYADIVRRPHLPEAGFSAARELALQSLAGLDDDPRQKLLVKLRERHLPDPYGRNTMGRIDHLESLTLPVAQSDHLRRYRPNGAIMAVAGKIDFDQLLAQVQKHFGDWLPQEPERLAEHKPDSQLHHENQSSEQTHIGIAYPSVPETHADYYLARVAMEVLSGGMSGRLFTEIREKRGLVYAVSAGYGSLKDLGYIYGYAGTSNDRAQATLDQFIVELHRLEAGITADELSRAKIGLKAATIMQGESTSSRSGSIAHDYFMRGRIRTLDEIKNAIDAITLEQVNEYLKRSPAGPFTIVTVGPQPLVYKP